MNIWRNKQEARLAIQEWKATNHKLALVPTMGALHEGHLSLVHAARKKAERVVVSIFVNPRQFGKNEDFGRYPRQEAKDIALLQEAGVDGVFIPDIDTIYQQGHATGVQVQGSLTEGFCGAFRPGHFEGVATIVSKLFLQLRPDLALFGEKDFQQLQVIRRFNSDLDIDVEIVGVPTLRDSTGLALSSRNAYLTTDELAIARQFNGILRQAIEQAIATPQSLAKISRESVENLLRIGFTKVDYLAFCAAENLQILESLSDNSRLLGAAWINKTRLIDNFPVV
ncbi:MAG: pantoate--beta-alanine ligase [Alphaproteobacteria bacterium]